MRCSALIGHTTAARHGGSRCRSRRAELLILCARIGFNP
jgi:hypothetical protein